MKNASPIATHLFAITFGIIGIFCLHATWHPAAAHLPRRMVLPAATQSMVGADLRTALPVIDPASTERDIPMIDAWLSKADAAKLAKVLRPILNHPAPALRAHWLRVSFARWGVIQYDQALETALGIESPSLRLLAAETAVGTASAQKQWAAVTSVSDPVLRWHLLRGYFGSCTPQTALLNAERATAITDPFERQMALETSAAAWARLNNRACIDWARHLNDPALRKAALLSGLRAAGKGFPDTDALRIALEDHDAATRRDLLGFVLVTYKWSVPDWIAEKTVVPDSTWQAPIRELLGAPGSGAYRFPVTLLPEQLQRELSTK